MADFKLNPVLDHRKHREEQLQKELADIDQRLAGEQAQLNGYLDRKTQLTGEFKSAQAEGITASQALLYQRYLEGLQTDLKQQSERVEIVRQEQALKRSELMEAVKKRKTLERLKEKQQIARNRHRKSQEQKLVDEVAQNRFNRHRSMQDNRK